MQWSVIYTGNVGQRRKLKFNLYRFLSRSYLAVRRNSRKSASLFEFTYLCFWNTVTVMGSLRSPPTIRLAMIVSSLRIARWNKRVDYSEDNWNLIFPRLEIYSPPMIFTWQEVCVSFFFSFFLFSLFLHLLNQPELLSFEFLSWA